MFGQDADGVSSRVFMGQRSRPLWEQDAQSKLETRTGWRYGCACGAGVALWEEKLGGNESTEELRLVGWKL